MDPLEEIVEGKREEWKDFIYISAGGFKLPASYSLDFAVAIYVYTLNEPPVYAAVNREMFNKGGGNLETSPVSPTRFECVCRTLNTDAASKRCPTVTFSKVKYDEGRSGCILPQTSMTLSHTFPWGRRSCSLNSSPRASRAPTAKTRRGYATIASVFVLFRPFSKFKVMNDQKSIIDAKELVHTQKSGFPDTVQLKQVCDTEEERRARDL